MAVNGSKEVCTLYLFRHSMTSHILLKGHVQQYVHTGVQESTATHSNPWQSIAMQSPQHHHPQHMYYVLSILSILKIANRNTKSLLLFSYISSLDIGNSLYIYLAE